MFDSLGVLRAVSISALMGLVTACGGGGNQQPVPSQAARRGETVFAQHCAHCHGIADAKRRDAPNLRDVIGRKAGATNFPYSAAFRNVDLVWNRETLDRFLADPRRLVPDNQMAFFGMPDPAARADLIAYLELNSSATAGR